MSSGRSAKPIRFGARLDERAKQIGFGHVFMECTPEQQKNCWKNLRTKEVQTDDGSGRQFFQLMRANTVVGYYTTKIGLESLGYPGVASGLAVHAGLPAHERSRARTFAGPVGEGGAPAARLGKLYADENIRRNCGRTGAGGGTAMKVLCEAGLSVCAINSGPRRNLRKTTSCTASLRLEVQGYGKSVRFEGRRHQERIP